MTVEHEYFNDNDLRNILENFCNDFFYNITHHLNKLYCLQRHCISCKVATAPQSEDQNNLSPVKNHIMGNMMCIIQHMYRPYRADLQ